MTHETFALIRAIGFLGALAAGLSLERWSRHASLKPNWRTNGGFWIVDGFVIGLTCGTCACSTAVWAARQGVGVLNAASVPLALAIPLAILGLDAVSYGWHRANHRFPGFWRFHRVHHSDDSFSVSTGLRFHPGELLLSLPLRLAAIAAIGAPVIGVAIFEVLFTVANLLEHGNINLSPKLERRLVRISITPALHRLHHSREHPHQESNFGTVFSFWDRMFGTFAPSSSTDAIDVGLSEVPGSESLFRALFLPFRPL